MGRSDGAVRPSDARRRLADVLRGDVEHGAGAGATAVCESANGPARLTRWQDLAGWFDWAPFYRDQVARIPDGGTIVELGCFLGRSVACLAEAVAESGKSIAIHAVDTWCLTEADTGPRMWAVIEAEVAAHGSLEAACRAHLVGRDVQVHQVDSWAAAERFQDIALDLVFVDDDHTSAHVLGVCLAWWPLVTPGGVLAGHDADWASVIHGVSRWAQIEQVLVHRIPPRVWMAQKER